MALATIAEASQQLGVSVHTLKRRLKRGEVQGQKRPTPQGFVWMVEVPDDASRADKGTPNYTDGVPGAPPDGIPDGVAREFRRMEELVAVLQGQVLSQGEELDARRREVQELHVLLQQTQAALPPARDGRPWWRWLLGRA